VQGIACHKLQVIPRKKTAQHFEGVMYFATDTLHAVLLEGTMAKLPFPLRKFYIKLRFGRHKGIPVVSRGFLDIEVKVPVFFHARFVNRFSASRHKLLPR